MQSISVYLYPNRVDAYTNPLTGSTLERYRKVYNRNLKLVKGVKNRVELRIMNGDQKKSNIGNQTVVFALVGKETNELILKKDCSIQDSTQGIAFLELFENELLLVEPGFYRYSLILETRSSIQNENHVVISNKPLYIDSNYGIEASIEIVGNIYGEPSDSITVTEFMPKGVFNEEKYFLSSIIEARSRLTVPQSTHTFQFLMTNYTGRVTIEASQSPSAGPHIWAPIAFFDSAESNSHYENIVGKFNWFRVRHDPNAPSSIATFTIAQTILNSYEVGIGQRGKGYKVGDQIIISGSKLGGESITNDLIITVASVKEGGSIESINWDGVSYPGVRTFVVYGDIPTVGSLDAVLYR